jgi:2-methylcitrate dehydratase PrpD
MTAAASPGIDLATLSPTRVLAGYAASLRLEDIPREVRARAKECLIDTIAIALRGREPPWSRIAVDLARDQANTGKSRLIGFADVAVRAESAAFTNGVLAHALELDSLRKPGAGVHPGAVVVAAALAAGQERGSSGKALLTAVIAGFEVLLRVGLATAHSAEPRGFHAPGLTGPFGAAAAAGALFGLNKQQMTSAFGIAGSTCSGLMQFAVEKEGAMVKRFHIGHAAQNGIVAARLAERGFSGPQRILEGQKGFLATYCGKYRVEALTAGLSTSYETLNLCLKRYPSHITAHTAVYAIERLRAEAGLDPGEVTNVRVVGTDRMAEFNSDREPKDPALANYSIPFCIAAALTGNLDDPATFDPSRIANAQVRDLCGRVEVLSDGRSSHSDWKTTTIVSCRDGRILEKTIDDFPGTPAMPLSAAELEGRFRVMSAGCDPRHAEALFTRLLRIEDETTVDWIY